MNQRYGIDYEETFSPVIRNESMRLLFALAAELNLTIDHMDVVTAFLHGNLKEEVYMKQPEGFEIKGKEHYVCKLQKAMYGLKQASRAWYEKISEVLLNRLGFNRSEHEPCVFVRNKRSLMIIALYVDDLLIFSNDEAERKNVKKVLSSEFEMKDLGDVRKVIGVRIRKENGMIKLDQKEYLGT